MCSLSCTTLVIDVVILGLDALHLILTNVAKRGRNRNQQLTMKGLQDHQTSCH